MQYLNLSRLDNTLKNNVLWPDGWMKMAWVSCGMNIANGKISCYPCQGEILYNEPYCWREESHVQPFLRLYMNSFVQKVQQPTYSFCPVVNVLFCLSNTAWEQIVLMDPDTFLYFTATRLSWCSGTKSNRSVSDTFWYIIPHPQVNCFILTVIPK